MQQLLNQELNSGVLNVTSTHNPLPAKSQNSIYKKFVIILLRDQTEESLNGFFKCSVNFLLKSLSLQAALTSLQETDRHGTEISSTSLTFAGCLTAQTMRFTVDTETAVWAARENF